MISILLGIISCCLLIAGVAYFVFEYAPHIANLWNSVNESLQGIQAFLPSWLVPFVGIALTLAFVGLLIKLL